MLSTLTFSLAPALQVAVLAALLVGLLSIAAGSLVAYFRGWVDFAVTSIGDAFSLLPPAIALLAAGLALTLIAAAFYLVAVGSRDAVIPRTRR